MSELERVLEERKLKNENLSRRTKATSPIVYGILVEFRGLFGDSVSIGWSEENGIAYGTKPKDEGVQFTEPDKRPDNVKGRRRKNKGIPSEAHSEDMELPKRPRTKDV